MADQLRSVQSQRAKKNGCQHSLSAQEEVVHSADKKGGSETLSVNVTLGRENTWLVELNLFVPPQFVG
jgi:hypothetical protein